MAVFVLLGVIVALLVVWCFCMRETITVAPGYLEKQRSLFGYSWTTTVSGVSVLRIETRDYGAWSRSGPRRDRILRAENLGRHVTVYEETRSRNLGFLGLFGDDSVGFDTAYLLANYLSVQTRWPIVDTANHKY